MFRYSFNLDDLDFALIHRWLSGTYWTPGITRERVEKGFRNSSLCIGCFEGEKLVGVCRCLTDTTRFAYLSDVFVDEAYRGRGIAREMVKHLLQHPMVSDADRCYLQTRDAHGVYEPLGFRAPKPADPPTLMVRDRPSPAS